MNISAVLERLDDRYIRIMQLDVLADERNADRLVAGVDAGYHVFPFVLKLGYYRSVKSQRVADYL